MPVSALHVALSPSLTDCAAEAKYVLRSLVRLAGFGVDFTWATGAGECDIFYGPADNGMTARLRIDAGPVLTKLWGREPRSFHEHRGLGLVEFERENLGYADQADGSLRLANDIVATSYWLLSGAREQRYPRDRHGSATLTGSFLHSNQLLARPLVSEYASFLRTYFTRLGRAPAALPWRAGSEAGFVFSHDVDYPQMIRWIEGLRLTRMRGLRGLRGVPAVLGGRNHFWRFDDWLEFERSFGARPAFYFSARQGSLWQYATGTPDCFYDIHSDEFRQLFGELRDAGCEIGLHASYEAFRSQAQFNSELGALRAASGGDVAGNRHHYFRVNPDAPHETLARHERAGLEYDSSLAFAYYPGYRRGVCHPFHAYHPDERREIGILQLPVAWMDDHFDRRLTINGVQDAEAEALRLLGAARAHGGVAVVDYHVRGMNADFFPRYGPWLREFAERHLDTSLEYATPIEVVRRFAAYERELGGVSRDRTLDAPVAARAADSRPAPASVTVGPLRDDESAAWDAFVDAHPDATIYHTLAWRRVTAEGLRQRARYLRAVTPDGGIVGVLPLFEVRTLGGRVLVSVPLRDKGGPLAAHADVAQQLARGAADLARQLRIRHVVIKGPADSLTPSFDAAGYAEEKHWVTTVVPVDMGEERLWTDVFRSPTRRAVNKARNAGMLARWSTDAADLGRFYDVFLKTRRALGVPPYPRRFFDAMWRHLVPRGWLRLLLVEKDGATQGALLVFPFKREVVSAYMGSDPASKDARVNDLLFWEAIRWSAAEGFASYYFGADSPHQEGLLQYKRKWGGQQFVLPNYHYTTNGAEHVSTDSSSPAYARVRRVIAALPEPVFRAFGAVMTPRLW